MEKYAKNSKVMKVFLIVTAVVALLVVSILLFQNSMAKSAIKAFENGDYISAKELSDMVFVDTLLDEYEENIDMMYRITYEYNRWKDNYGIGHFDYDFEQSRCIGLALNVLDECISYSYIAEINRYETPIYQLVNEVSGWLCSIDVDIEHELIARFEEKGISAYYPLFKHLRGEAEVLGAVKKVARFAETGGIMCKTCGNWAHCFITNPLSGDIDSYCETHFQEVKGPGK